MKRKNYNGIQAYKSKTGTLVYPNRLIWDSRGMPCMLRGCIRSGSTVDIPIASLSSNGEVVIVQLGDNTNDVTDIYNVTLE